MLETCAANAVRVGGKERVCGVPSACQLVQEVLQELNKMRHPLQEPHFSTDTIQKMY